MCGVCLCTCMDCALSHSEHVCVFVCVCVHWYTLYPESARCVCVCAHIGFELSH